MNIYIIYKFNDYTIVKETVDNIRDAISAEHSIFMFEPNRKPKFWRFHARKKLKESNLVLLFDSLSGGKSEVGRHISWEVKYAAKQDKKVLILKTDPASTDRTWYEYDYSEQAPLHSKYTTIPIADAVAQVKKVCDWHMNDNLLHSDTPQNLTPENMALLIEQYRIMVDTSEKLMERRQTTTNLYTTLATTLIAFIGASFAFDNMLVIGIILLVSGLILILLCRNWRLSLDAFDVNNTGKFAVINLLEKYLPAEIFECEYRFNKQKGMRSFSAREKHLPNIFTGVGIVLIVFAACIFLYMLLIHNGVLPSPEPEATETLSQMFFRFLS